ncbi:dimethylaniline monooxygenase [N-oxide-forming] 5-like isoform X1 [Lacerta agilis]|uniref:dimethylaniline monooxygenase [N-oxide-forming] 5-like isoform X1 n=2 Tax=Lacerta agilis TaxID=80427 RepID=UPI001419FD52|nr:dimethylaniline monooxygenase [N-oxide-forming] 5-like isoform X1 [Lacerta agilis]XP_033007221.1 dimethylaniline monooxygenase [N-oxide-forming] 5-like isoform X1 [Lacerta agilis]XP_033007222.1 dimethylaniline monooxygenase [N-oxide-forming] 5-like isoform X1 [Lacerta agilis]
MAKRVAVIGAGASGLTAIKCCLDEGLQPTCFERSDDIGGLWRFQEHDIGGQASIYKSLTINTSKEMMSYSDFPIPAEYPNYMHHSKVMDYFRMYAEHFDLLKHIRFKACVCSIKKRPDFPITGQWEVVSEIYGKQESAIFDAVLVCTGHHIDPYFPLDLFPGVEKFKGKIMHSREYKHPEKFRDQRILVIGLGNSGADISVDLSHVTKQIFLSTRTGTWVVNRVSDDGYPLDVVHFTRFKNLLRNMLPCTLVNLWGEKKLNTRFNHENYGIKPQHRFLSRYPIAADDLPNAIISGRVLMKPNVKEFTERGVVFEDGSREEDIDVVIFATGYNYSFAFVEEGVIQTRDNWIPLYKFVFPPRLEKPTLAIVGLLQPLGAIMPIAELQARWATRIFKGLLKLPSEDEMMADITEKIKYNEKRYVPSQHTMLQVQYVDHMDELASLSGVKPNLLRLILTDPKLAWEVFFGPCSPVQFRLTGPGKWEGARNAILNQKVRIVKATKTRGLQTCVGTSLPSTPCFFIKVLGCLAFFAILVAYL